MKLIPRKFFKLLPGFAFSLSLTASVALTIAAPIESQAKGKAKAAKAEVVVEEEAAEPMSAKLVVGEEAKASTPAAAESALVAETGSGATAATTDTAASNVPENSSVTVSPTDAVKAAQAKLPEDQIPVLQAKKDAKQAGGGGFFRIFMTLGVLAVAFAAAAFGMNRLAKKSGAKNQKNTRIKVLTSHHLGPKKNLTIVQVAGETILLGVTDNNITMLKTLSLLDDEIPESVPQRFDHSMDDFIENDEMEDDEPIAMRGLSEIRDTVSTRLKNMRNL